MASLSPAQLSNDNRALWRMYQGFDEPTEGEMAFLPSEDSNNPLVKTYILKNGRWNFKKWMTCGEFEERTAASKQFVKVNDLEKIFTTAFGKCACCQDGYGDKPSSFTPFVGKSYRLQ